MIKGDKPQLAKIIKEVIDDMDAHNSHEGSMARSQLGRTAEIAAMLQDMIDVGRVENYKSPGLFDDGFKLHARPRIVRR